MKEKCIRFIKRIALLIALSQSFMGKISAQENTDAVTPFQLSFAPGLGTNGTQSHLKVNRFSFNIIGGRSKGNISFEFGGIFNINTELTKGLQMAGIETVAR